jgi:hypothetical protein
VTSRRQRLGCLALAALTVLVPLAFGLRGTVIRIESYRLLDADTLAVQVTHGNLDWTRVGSVDESATSVEVEVRMSTVPVPQTNIGYALDLTVQLVSPLGDRRVIDAGTGLEVSRQDDP